MTLSAQAQAVMLLTVPFGKSGEDGAKPLSAKEWARFAVWLKTHDLEPSAFLKGDMAELLAGWTDRSITLSRLERLLDRGGGLGLLLEKWQRAGLWIITRSDPEYPDRLKRKLRLESPPVLFGCGNKRLLGRGGIAVVGSRNAGQDDIDFSVTLGEAAARQGYSIVSGGARGVDQSAMLGALRNEGTAIGVMADSLLRSATSARYRQYLLSDDLALITPFNPEAGFNVGKAMSRNRYIYCLADAAVVVSSTPYEGGTWNGAIEDIEAAWAPLWVKRTASEKSGNVQLVQKGAHWLPDDLTSLACLLNGSSADAADGSQAGLPLRKDFESGVLDSPVPSGGAPEAPLDSVGAGEPAAGSTPSPTDLDFYTLFLVRMLEITGSAPLNAKDIALRLDLGKSQVDAWLRRGVSDGQVRKLERPVRYQSSSGAPRQPSLF